MPKIAFLLALLASCASAFNRWQFKEFTQKLACGEKGDETAIENNISKEACRLQCEYWNTGSGGCCWYNSDQDKCRWFQANANFQGPISASSKDNKVALVEGTLVTWDRTWHYTSGSDHGQCPVGSETTASSKEECGTLCLQLGYKVLFYNSESTACQCLTAICGNIESFSYGKSHLFYGVTNDYNNERWEEITTTTRDTLIGKDTKAQAYCKWQDYKGDKYFRLEPQKRAAGKCYTVCAAHGFSYMSHPGVYCYCHMECNKKNGEESRDDFTGAVLSYKTKDNADDNCKKRTDLCFNVYGRTQCSKQCTSPDYIVSSPSAATASSGFRVSGGGSDGSDEGAVCYYAGTFTPCTPSSRLRNRRLLFGGSAAITSKCICQH